MVDVLDSEGKTPLLSIMASQTPIFQPVIDLLVPRTTNFAAKTQIGETCLILAAKSSNFETLKILIEKSKEQNIDINQVCDNGGNCLQAALSAGNQEIVDFLVEAGCTINLNSTAKGKFPI